MANTFTQLHVHYIFAPKFRASLIESYFQEPLHQFITGIFQNNKHRMIQINSMTDHIHILAGLNPTQSISSIIQNVKTESSKWINEKIKPKQKFAWQEGYGAFSYSKKDINAVAVYIQNQKVHHSKHTFLQEYKAFLTAFEVPFSDQYIFKEPI